MQGEINNIIHIRQLKPEEYIQALALSLEVFIQYGKDDYDEEGLASFKSFLDNKDEIANLKIYGAFEENKLTGIIATKKSGTHISLFFIKPEFQGKGIGRKLFEYAIQENPAHKVTVNSSTYAIPIYRSLGFKETADKQKINGLAFTPMKHMDGEQIGL